MQDDPTDDAHPRRGRPRTYADLEWMDLPPPAAERQAWQRDVVDAVLRQRALNPSMSLKEALERAGHGEVSERSYYRYLKAYRD